MPPDLSVILPTHNGAAFIAGQLEALAHQDWDRGWELIVVDDGSTDATPDIVRAWLARLPVPATVVPLHPCQGLAHARNAGVAAASGRSVAFVDDDDLVAPGWVRAMGEALDAARLVGSSFEYTRLNDAVAARARGGFQVTALGEVFGVPVATGGGLGCRTDLWHALGGNDETYTAAGEDLDFSLRATLDAGVVPVLCPDAVYHVRVRSGAVATYRQARRFAAATVRVYAAHGSRLDARPESVTRLVRRWAGLALRLPRLRTAGGRQVWLWQLGVRVGRLEGSLRHRTWYP